MDHPCKFPGCNRAPLHPVLGIGGHMGESSWRDECQAGRARVAELAAALREIAESPERCATSPSKACPRCIAAHALDGFPDDPSVVTQPATKEKP